MDDPGEAARRCSDCWEILREVHRPLSERYAKLVARQSKGRVSVYRCPHTGAWHLNLNRYPATEEACSDEHPAGPGMCRVEPAGGDQ